MKAKRLDGIYLLTLSAAIFLFLVIGMRIASPDAMFDFKIVYSGARILAGGADPYQPDAFLNAFLKDGQAQPSREGHKPLTRASLERCIYPPPALLLVAPLTWVPFAAAQLIWLVLLLGSFVTATVLAWDLASEYEPISAGALAGFLMANNLVAIAMGNTAVLVVAFCVIAVWCFVRERFGWVGVLLMAAALALKPHDAAWVWLALLLHSRVSRRRAAEAAVAVAVLCGVAIIWASRVAPAWAHELRQNVAFLAAAGGLNDPSLAAKGENSVGLVISLQSIFSGFDFTPRAYDTLSVLICAPFLAIWAWLAMRAGGMKKSLWFGLAALLPLAMLPVYHRPYDAKLLLLAIPACALLASERLPLWRTAIILNTLAIVLTGDVPWLLAEKIREIHPGATLAVHRAWTALWVYPVPLVLLGAGIFNLYLFHRAAEVETADVEVQQTATAA